MDNKKLTIDDIARELQISKTTVSRAISGKGRIGQETREKVLRYIKENNYKPSAIARGLAQSKTFNISLVMPGDSSLVDLPFYHNFLWGISNTASKSDYDVIISMVSEKDITQLVRLIENNKVDGVVLGRTLEEDIAEKYLKQKGIPFVTAGSSLDPTVIQVDNDHRSACRELTSVLFSKRIRRVALIGSDMKTIVSKNRLAGFRDACTEFNVFMEDDLIYLDMDSETKIEEAVEDILKKNVECIICMDDYICGCVLEKLEKENVNIPEDIKVASFYDSSLLESRQSVNLSLKFNVTEIAAACCNTLLSHIDKKDVPVKTLLGYEVVIREATQS
ncbi:MAG: LacI family DNA-binding transcriptional regulator [Lachnospiraceae bacterium]|nr:LacI family DNA-binding transcriptional regulator [Lachnospiraceae bacterium]